MPKFCILPEQASYAVTDGPSFVQTELEGGLSRRRADVLNMTSIVDVKWIFDREEFTYFRAFFNTATKKGALPFQLDLILDNYYPEEFTCAFVEKTVKLSEQAGLAYTVTAQLEVIPNEVDDVLNQLIIDENSCEATTGNYLANLLQTEADDTLVSTGSFGAVSPYTADSSYNENDDSLTSSGNATVAEIFGSSAISEDADSASSTSEYADFYGIADFTEDNDTLTSSGTGVDPI